MNVNLAWNTKHIKPESGRRIIALFDDGSGGDVFMVHDGVLLNHQGVEEELASDYDLWAYLPDSFRLWFEENEERRP